MHIRCAEGAGTSLGGHRGSNSTQDASFIGGVWLASKGLAAWANSAAATTADWPGGTSPEMMQLLELLQSRGG